MPTFQYKARTREGESRTGTIETSSRDAALEFLHQNNLIVVALQEKPRSSLLGYRFGTGVKQRDVVIFSRQIATLFEAHIPVIETLKTLMVESENPFMREALGKILDDVTGGLVLSQSLAKHSQIFSSFYVQLVRSGEESGKLQEVFTYLADYLERSYELSSKARNSLIYPAFVLTAFVGVLVVMLVTVIPRLISIFQETGQEIPFYTQAVIALALFLREWGVLLLLLLAAVSFFLWRWSRLPAGKLFFHQLQISLPLFGVLYRKLFLARLTDNLRTLIVGGIPIIRALLITSEVVGNALYQKALAEAAEAVKSGNTISSAFERNPVIPPLVTQMLRIGEASGKVDFILGSVSRYYQREVDTALENLVSLIEPALIVFLGVGIGILVASVLVPLYNLVATI